MRFTSTALAAAALLSSANAAYKGFNYGAYFGNNQAKAYADFKYEFEAAQELPETNGEFTAARLYTMIQWGTTNSVIAAIQAAIDTNTQLLLGIWASGGQTGVDNELTALKSAISQYGTKFTDLVVGISVGSEDLYRITPTAISNGETNPGAQPSELVNYVGQVRTAIKGTGLAGKPIGHVDTWTAYVNGSNSAVISALDFLGVDAYPYWQTQMANSIGNANATFYDAYKQTVAAAQGKPVWVTETGWPVSGPQQNQAVASTDNARIYWEDVSCSLIKGNVNLFYYTLQDVQYSTPSPSFGIKPGGDLKAVSPLFDLSCPDNPTATLSSSSTGIPTSSGTLSISITDIPTSLPTFVTTSAILSTLPSSTPTETPFPGLPVLGQPRGLTAPFVAPNLIVPIDSSDPSKIIGNQYTAQLSPTRSTLFVFDLAPDTGKICNLVFAMAPVSDLSEQSPYTMNSPGGISVSRLEKPADTVTTSSTISTGQSVGSVPALLPGNKYLLSSAPCEAGQQVGYRVDSAGGLDMNFFQMTSPALGLFMETS